MESLGVFMYWLGIIFECNATNVHKCGLEILLFYRTVINIDSEYKISIMKKETIVLC